MGIVLQFQSLPNSRRQASAQSLPAAANRHHEAKIIIFPGIRVDRDKAGRAAVGTQRSVGDGPAE